MVEGRKTALSTLPVQFKVLTVFFCLFASLFLVPGIMGMHAREARVRYPGGSLDWTGWLLKISVVLDCCTR